VWQHHVSQHRWVARAYHAYSVGKQTLKELSLRYRCDVETLRRQFDRYCPSHAWPAPSLQAVPLVFDATFFGRGYGLLIYRTQSQNIYWQQIDSEKIDYIRQGLLDLRVQGWRFASFTIDGRRGVAQLLQSLFSGTPVQMCLYHQKAIVRRYTTLRPRTECGRAIAALMAEMMTLTESDFLQRLQTLKQTWNDFLKERTEQGQFRHRKLRAALRSLTTNLPYLYTWKRCPHLNIPTTTNSCDGSFAHWKSKVKLHRGLRHHRRSKMIHFLLSLS
jgi:hypothetical protein